MIRMVPTPPFSFLLLDFFCQPDNIMLSSANSSDAMVKLVDFGGAEIITSSSDSDATTKQTMAATLPYNKANEDRGHTPAYFQPEVLQSPTNPLEASMVMWSLGIIMYIMLTGLHPFDLYGKTPQQGGGSPHCEQATTTFAQQCRDGALE
jgi:serine/threonine protein kinase